MKLLIRLLIALIAVIAAALIFYPKYPTITASLILLGPLTILLVAMFFCRVRKRWILLGCAIIPALFAFYIGLSGPLFANIVIAEEKVGQERTAMRLVALHEAYPISILDSRRGPISEAFIKYQAGWLSFYKPEFWEESRFAQQHP